MPDPRLCLEALSALLSPCSVESTPGSSQLSPQDLVNIVALKEFLKQQGFLELDYPSLGTMSLQDPDPDPDQDLYGPPPALTEGAPPGPRTTVKINPQDFFHPSFDYDFTHIKDGNRTFVRGDERYVRPCGWNRIALFVTRKYDDGNDSWLGTGKDAWPVSYQGHNMDGSLGIILTHSKDTDDEPGFLDAAAASLVSDQTKGRGVYSTPDIKMAEKYCKTFKSKVDGKTYKVVLQNRINPQKRRKCQRDNMWLVYVPEGLTEIETRALIQESIRPYGVLIKEV
ncbi:uncharacterized protein LOC115427903 [Sphaeramia orbicularis]|uniref:uncharacterized protein LOC115427903 n=1 Tax=Sphaeramia orbicularis TaxID=375764 RepID=UPI00117EE831|nr:uncharacterized protein LOC115427903 [Sphaeramia orbicularis]